MAAISPDSGGVEKGFGVFEVALCTVLCALITRFVASGLRLTYIVADE